MNSSSFLGKSLPHIIAVVSFLAISIFMYRPIIFEGKVMDQNDINQGKGANQEIVEFRKATGEEALWTNGMFGGMPAYLINVRWSGATIINATQKMLSVYLPSPISENFIAFLAFYILCLAFGVRPYLAIGGAIAFGLSTFYVISIHAGHIWKIRAIAYMPLVVAGIRLVFAKKYLTGFLLTAFALALELNSNHLQITYYLFLMLVIYSLSELFYAIKSKETAVLPTKIGVLVVAGLLAIGTNLGKLWTTYEYGSFSIRGKSELSSTPAVSKAGLDRDYAFRWSSGQWESMTLLIPHLYGGGSGVYAGKNSETADFLRKNNVQRNEISQYERAYLGYWGAQPGTAGPAYAGAVVCFLFILSLFFLSKRTKYWMLTVIAFAIMLSWGSNFPSFNNLMFDLFPGYNKFRSVTMVIILALMLLPLMGILGIEQLLQAKWTKDIQKKTFIAAGISIGMALFALMVTNPPGIDGMQKALADTIESDRTAIIKKDVFRTILYIALTFGAIYFLMREKIAPKTFSIILAVLILLDLGLVDSRYLNDSVYKKANAKSFLDKTPADDVILKDNEQDFRVLNLQNPFNEARTSYFHKSVGGYHGAKMRRYQDVISRHLTQEMQQIIEDKKLTKANSGVISMLNTKYLMAGYQANGVIPNPYVLGAAWIVDDIKLVNSPDEEIKEIGHVNLRTTAVIDKSKFDINSITPDTLAQIKLIDYQPNQLVYESNTAKPTLAVFSEIYYPKGWSATIDGNDVEILRANYLLRALEIPAGNHKIEFRFAPKSFFVGNTIMWVCSVVLLGMLIFMLSRKFYFQKQA